MLGVVGSSLKMVKFGPTTPNTSQHVATGWPNARNMLRPTMLRYVELTCCDRLAGALHAFGHRVAMCCDMLSPGQTIATFSATCCARLATLLGHVGCCWLKFENGQIFHPTFVDVA